MRSERGMFYTDTGPDGADRTMMFVHGWGVNGRYFERVIGLMSDVRCITVDLPGFGRSIEMASDVPCSVPLLTEFVHDLVGELDVDPVLCGHSMGGMISQEYALTYPDDLAGLVLMDTSPRPGHERTWRYLTPLSPLMFPLGFRPCMRWFARRYAINAPLAPQEALDLLDEIVVLNRKGRLRDCIKGMLRWTSEERLGDIRSPTLIVHGDVDRMLNVSNSAILSGGIPNARCVIMKGVGHSPTIERPEETARVLGEFLTELRSG